MKRILYFMASVLLFTLVVSAEEGEQKMAKKCTGETQACLNHMAESMSKTSWDGIWVDGVGTDKVVVKSVEANSAGAAAGFQKDDVLVAMNDTKLAGLSGEDFNKIMSAVKIGETVTYKLQRDEKWVTSKVTMTAMPQETIATLVGQHLLKHHLQSTELASN